MFSWKKLGRVFVPQEIEGRPWLKEFAQAPATLVFDDFVRVYFSCRPERDANGQYVSNTAFVDLNRKNLLEVVGVADQPILPLGGLGTFDEFGIYPTSVIRDAGNVVAFYGGWTRCESVPYNVAAAGPLMISMLSICSGSMSFRRPAISLRAPRAGLRP